MTRTRKLLSVKEFSQLVSESLDVPTTSQSLLEHNAVVSEPLQKLRPTSFHRIFSRPRDSPPDDSSLRKMITWPFSRSPRTKHRPDEFDIAIGDNDPALHHSPSPYTVTSPAATSTSSLGSLVPIHECLFQVTSRESDGPSQNSSCHLFDPSTSPDSTEQSHSVANSERDSSDRDPTPPIDTLSVIAPSLNAQVLSLRPAVGVAPHVPSETDSSVSACTSSASSSTSSSSPTSPVTRGSSPTFSTTRPSTSETSPPQHVPPPSSPPNRRISAVFPDMVPLSNLEPAAASSLSPRQPTKRTLSRSMTPPPFPRPPPTGPLPAVPSSVPPVPPLPSLLNKMPTSPPRSTVPTTGLPPSPPGGLRLPSRLSWVNSVRAVLPSPPASPKSKTSRPVSMSKVEVKRPSELKRPTSIGVIEAADGAQVRRTKSILLLGSRSKSNVSLGMKRVQIHADVSSDDAPSRKPRRKSSAATVGHPAFSADACPAMTPSELLVPRERRHSAPILSSLGRESMASADWTLSLPFCTDVPGNKILPSPLLTPQLTSACLLEEEDWTLCMPLKVRVGTPTTEGCESECTLAETSAALQLPTPGPSPTFSVGRALDPEVCVERPGSPASLGPHVGGLDVAGGRGKRASGWHVYGWFDDVDVSVQEEEEEEEGDEIGRSTALTVSTPRYVKNHVRAFCKTHNVGRHPSEDSVSSVSTSETMFYSARSSLLVC